MDVTKTTAPAGTESIYAAILIPDPRREEVEYRETRTDIVAGPLRPLVILRRILNGICRPDYLGEAVLALRRPHGDAGEKTAVVDFELDEGVRDIASGCI